MFAMKKTRTSTLWTAALSAVAAAGLFASCDKTPSEPVTPPVEWPEAAEGLANQYQCGSAETVDIKSVVYDYSKDAQSYLFVFSTVEGAEEVETVLKTDSKAFCVSVPTVDGAVDALKTWGIANADQTFSVVSSNLSGKEHSVKLSVKLSEQGTVAADVEYVGETPEVYFFLKYEGACVKEYHEPVLVNQMLREDRTVTELKSLVLQTTHSNYYPEDNKLAFALYKEDGITADNVKESGATPCLLVMLGEEIDDTDINFETYKGVYTVMAGNLYFSSEYGDEGTAVGTYKYEDKVDSGIALELEFTVTDKDGMKSVKAVYDGSYTTLVNAYGYSCGGSFGIVPKNVFREKTASGVRYVFGSNVDATTPEQLKEGDFAVSVTIPAEGLGVGYELKTATDCKVEFYDYKNYTVSTIDKDKLASYGFAYIEEGEDDGKVYTQLEEVEFADGVEIDGAAYSTIVDATIPDLTPVAPFTPTITITNEDGSKVLFEEPIVAMQVCHFKNERDFAGNWIDGYAFYFLTKDSAADVDSSTDYAKNPCFILPDIAFGCTDYDLYAACGEQHDDLKWSLAYNNDNLSLHTGYGYDVPYMINRIPEVVTLTAKRDGSNWHFKLVLQDYGMFYYGVDYGGTKNYLTIEWKGAASKYTGSKYTNIMTDQDY